MNPALQELIAYLRRFTGAPYWYGGNGPHFDCSGLVCEALKYAGILHAIEDLNAQQLYNKFHQFDSSPQAGALVFFGQDINHVSHVAFAISETRMIEAGGGDEKTRDIIAANKEGAMVRERLFTARKDLLTFAWPQYSH